MYWTCDICDKVIFEEFRNNHLQFGYHKRLANSIIRKYIFTKPDGVDDTIAKYLRKHFKKYEKFFCNIFGQIIISIENKNYKKTLHM